MLILYAVFKSMRYANSEKTSVGNTSIVKEVISRFFKAKDAVIIQGATFGGGNRDLMGDLCERK
jgi:hypothetical protein